MEACYTYRATNIPRNQTGRNLRHIWPITVKSADLGVDLRRFAPVPSMTPSTSSWTSGSKLWKSSGWKHFDFEASVNFIGVINPFKDWNPSELVSAKATNVSWFQGVTFSFKRFPVKVEFPNPLTEIPVITWFQCCPCQDANSGESSKLILLNFLWQMITEEQKKTLHVMKTVSPFWK